MNPANFKKKVFISIIISLVSFSLILLASKLTQKSQENRSKATTNNQISEFFLESPYLNPQIRSFKGSIHCHSNISDAENNIDPTHVFQFYKNLNYDFISLTDHLNYPSNNSSKIKSLQENNNTGVDILTLPGMERFIDEDYDNTGHINTISNKVLVNELNSESTGISIDELKIDDSNKIKIINHPDRQSDYWTDDKLNRISNYNGIEVWNNGDHEYYWDKILSSGKKIWGFASDDCHNYGNDSNCGSSFIRVFAQSLNRDDIFNNIKKGNFYSLHIPKDQPEISLDITTSIDSITVNTNIGTTILFISDSKVVKQSNNDTTLSYSPSGEEKYVRVKVLKSDSIAWSNPIFIKKTNNSDLSSNTITTTKTDNFSPNINFKIAFQGIKPDNQKCFDQLKIDVEIIDFLKNKTQTISDINIDPIINETNSKGEQVFQISKLQLDPSIFQKSDKSIFIKIRGPFHLQQKMCLDNQKEKVTNNNSCNIDLEGTKIYDFSEYSLLAGDIDKNGIINNLDFSFIKNNLGNYLNCKTLYDLNLDGAINNFDLGIIKKTLLFKDDE